MEGKGSVSETSGKNGKSPEIADTVPTPGGAEPSSEPSGPTLDPEDVPNQGNAAEAPLVGRRLGNYEVLGHLATGGFGEVYLARDTSLDRRAAIKFMRNPLDRGQLELFEREAKALAALGKTPAIVQIYGWDTYRDQHYFALEFVEGSARKLLKEKPEGLPVAVALGIAADCAEALHAAHQLDILHRDVKTANILVEPNGQAKLTDFGLAHFKGEGEFSIAGFVSGSPGYMSPEQAVGKALDARTDIFSLGVTLYELLSGQRPFEGDTAGEVVASVKADRRRPLRDRRPDLAAEICAVVEKAMAHRPGQRYQTAADFAHELRVLINKLERRGAVGGAGGGRVSGPRWVPGVMAACAVLLVVLALAPAVVKWRGRGERGGPSVHSALAVAQACMDRGDFAAAEEAYRRYLEAAPAEDRVLYGLVLARIGLRKLDEARAEAASIGDDAVRRECQAVLDFHARGEEARDTIEAAAPAASTPYPKVLLSKIDVAKNEYGQVVERLQGLTRDRFRFGYQYAESLQTLGQAYYRMNDYAQAQAVFRQLQDTAAPARQQIAGAYLRIVTQKLDEARHDRVRERAQAIRALLDAEPEPQTEADLWTSRPLTFLVLPVEVRRSRYALEAAWMDLLPGWLSDALARQSAMEAVERENIDDILAEQELSGLLSDKAGQLALGRILGARLMLQCTFARLGEREVVTVKMVDVESTVRKPVERVVLGPSAAPDDVAVDAIASAVYAAARSAYPLQARLYAGADAPEINIGATVGLRPGMVFDAFADPDASPVPDLTVRVGESVGGRVTPVEVSGRELTLPAEPKEGLFVRERPADVAS